LFFYKNKKKNFNFQYCFCNLLLLEKKINKQQSLKKVKGAKCPKVTYDPEVIVSVSVLSASQKGFTEGSIDT